MKRAFGFAVITAALLLAACGGEALKGPVADAPAEPAVTAPETPVVEAPVSAKPEPVLSEVDCKTAGGEWRPVCRLQKNMCVQTFADAGKTCSGASDCSGRCLAEGSPEGGKPATGKCAVNNDPCGCYQVVEGGVAQATICVD